MDSKAKLIANAKLLDISVKKLQLDFNNARFNHMDKPEDSEIEEIIRKDSDTTELFHQILSAGVVYEPLIVKPDYTVVEGNRRLVCLRSILKQIEDKKLPNTIKEKFQTVRCRVIPVAADSKTIDMYLASLHVKGKKPWKKFNRANHIFNLNRVHDVPYERLADELGMGKTTIKRCIDVYTTLLDYSRKFPEDEAWFHKFTYFDYFFQRQDLKHIREERGILDEFKNWVHDKKFKDVRDIYRLADVISDKDALNVLRKTTFDAALKTLEEKDPSNSNPAFKRVKDAIESLDEIRKEDPSEIIKNPGKMKLLLDLESEIKTLMVDIDVERASLRKTKEMIIKS